MPRSDTLRIFIRSIGIAVAAIAAFAIHVKYGNFVGGVVSNAMSGVEIARPPYGLGITTTAALTSLLPTLGVFIIFALIYDKLPSRSPLIKGVLFAVLRMFSEGQMVRMPLMNALVGNPLWVVALQQSEIWATNLLLSFVLAYSIELSRKHHIQFLKRSR